MAQTQVGNAWSNKPINFGYDLNESNEVVKFTTISSYANYTITSKVYNSVILGGNNGYYPANTLYKNTITDEDGNVSIAVSYTHLDVYKRQVKMQLIFMAHVHLLQIVV